MLKQGKSMSIWLTLSRLQVALFTSTHQCMFQENVSLIFEIVKIIVAYHVISSSILCCWQKINLVIRSIVF